MTDGDSRDREYVVLRSRTIAMVNSVHDDLGPALMFDVVARVEASTRAQAFEKAKAGIAPDPDEEVRLMLIPARFARVVTWRQKQTTVDEVEGL